MASSSKKFDAFNARMAQLVPELESEYGKYPMKREKWVSPSEMAPENKKAFIASPKAPGGTVKPVLMDYVWGPGTRGFGYYHLTTKDSYKILAARLQSQTAPDLSCCLGKSTQQGADKQDLKEIEIIMHYRSESPKPDDDVARAHGAQQNAASFRPPDDIGFWELRLKEKGK